MTLLVAQLALRRVGGAAACSVSLDPAGVACAGELAFDSRVGAVSLVVTDFAAVVALASETAARRVVGAFAGEVTGLVAAANVSA